MQNQKGFIIPLIITIVVIAILGTGGYFAYKQLSSPKQFAQTATEQIANKEQDATPKTQTPPANGATAQTAGWKTYTSNELSYSFKYPSSWRVMPNFVYSAAGAGGLVGYTITTSDSKTPLDSERIDIGGAQIDCQHLVSQDGLKYSTDALCKTNLPIYTFSTDPNVINVFNIMVDSISEIKTITDIDYNFKIEYPNNWFAEKNSFNNAPDLVFCPPNLTYHSSGVTGCMIQPSGYQSGMIYLFAYGTDPKSNNTNYQYLGFNSGKYYYLFNDSGSKDIFSQMISTFKFTK